MKYLILAITMFLCALGIARVNLQIENSNHLSITENIEQTSSDQLYNSGIEFYYKKEYVLVWEKIS